MPTANTSPLSRQERERLAILLAEAKSRKIVVPNSPQTAAKIKRWHVDENGYFIKIDGKHYEASVNQEGFINSRARFSLFYGSRGSGKSGAGAQKAMKKVRQGESGAVLNPDFENFRYSTWPEFKNWIDWDMVVPSQRNRASPSWQPHQPFVMVFLDGTRVYCKGLKNPESARGPNINWLWYDEAGRDPDGVAWQLANASVRVGFEPESWATTTPKGMVHWLYDFFIERNIPEEALEAYSKVAGDRPLIEVFHGLLDENKEHLDPMFYASLLTTYPSGYLRAQELDGEFANEGGQVGDRRWFAGKHLDSYPEDWDIFKQVRYWDMAATEKKVGNDPDEAVGTLLKSTKDGKFVVCEQVCGYWEWKKLKERIRDTARRDGATIKLIIEQEPGSGGKNQVAEIQSYLQEQAETYPELRGVKVEGVRPTDRVAEAYTWFAEAQSGNMYIIRGDWNDKFFAQLDGFTQARHDDRVTSLSGAFHVIRPFKVWKKVPFLKV